MTPEQIELVQTSFQKVVPIKETAGQLFYNRLFELDPSLRKLFQEDLSEQIENLMTMIATAVNGLKRLDSIVGAVQDLGRRHVGFGVKDADYETVGAALIWTLEQGLGSDFTPDTKDAWIACYALLSTTMRDAAAQPAAAE